MKVPVQTSGSYVAITVCLPLVICIAGCGGANFGSEFESRPSPTALTASEAATTRLPQDYQFSIHRTTSTDDSGLGGTAEPTASAAADGSADVSVEVAEGGEASAVFQLGHAFENKSTQQVDLDVLVRFHFEYNAESTSADRPVDGSVGLKLYARDDRNRLVRNDELIAHALDKGPTQGSGDRDHRFTVTLGPGRSVSVFLAGQTQAKALPGRAGNCALRISGLSMEVTTRAAPAPRTASDEQG